MGRTREAALRGAVRAVAKYGSRKATMGDIAMLAGIAKATLYNHFRTRDDVYRAAIAMQIDEIAAASSARAADGLEAVLAEAARLVAEHPAGRRIALEEPATLAALAAPSSGALWESARAHVAQALDEAGQPGSASSVDLVIRYLASLLLEPSTAAQRAECARLIAAALRDAQRSPE